MRLLAWLACLACTLESVAAKTYGRQDFRNFFALTTNGIVKGARSSSGGGHYVIPYAEPPVGPLRFRDPVPTKLKFHAYDASHAPPDCPHSESLMPASANEDCLYMQIYTPPNTPPASRLPVMIWFHGGGNVEGSSNLPGLDGSVLAKNQNVIVVVPQYRLGILGFLAARSAGVSGNFAIKDVMLALNFFKMNAVAFGGDPNLITLFGQSSGANLIKTLLSVPAADTLFSRAILHSPVLDYGEHTSSTAQFVGSATLEALHCSTLVCLQRLSVGTILNRQLQLTQNLFSLNRATGTTMQYRPWVDGKLIKQDFTKSVNGVRGGLTNKQRQIIITTVKDESAYIIGSLFPDPLPDGAFDPILQAQVASPIQYNALTTNGIYKADLQSLQSNDDRVRIELTKLSSDYFWTCSSQQTAVNLTMLGGFRGKVWLAEFDIGIPYTFNQYIPFCSNLTCHQDDIFAIFGTKPSPVTTLQLKLSNELQSRWSTFAKTGNPNPSSKQKGFVNWLPVVNQEKLNLLSFQNPSSVIVQRQRETYCKVKSKLWGVTVPFDFQLFT